MQIANMRGVNSRLGRTALRLMLGLALGLPGVARADSVTSGSVAPSPATSAGTATGPSRPAPAAAAVAAPAPIVPATAAAPVPSADPVKSQAAAAMAAPIEDATGKPSAAQLQATLAARRLKNKPLHAAARKPKTEQVAVAAPPPPKEPPDLLTALFGGGASPAPGEETGATSADPATTAATGAVDPDILHKSKAGKGVKTATAVPAESEAPSVATDAPWPSGDDTPMASGELGMPLLSPGNIEPLKAAIKRYADIVAHGGWPTVPPLQMELSTNNPAVGLLRQRLAAEGDLPTPQPSFWGANYFDAEMGAAVKRFQDRYGLSSTGDLMDGDRLKNGTRTVMALNVTAEARLAQLKANLTRLQTQTIAKGRYVVVNIPGEQIEAVDANQVALRLNGVVGRPERPSPLLSSNIEEVKFNPTWTLPPTVVKEDLLPKGVSLQAKGVDVLTKFGIDAYDGNGKKLDSSKINWSSATAQGLRFMQQPGKDNPLGFAKLDFASPQSVYMHDTPSSKLFDKSYRAASSGCIRVDHMDRLAAWLLRETDGWAPAHVLQMKQSGESKIVRLKHAVPLHWVYITAWATQDGIVHFRRDLYGKDQAFGVSQTASAY